MRKSDELLIVRDINLSFNDRLKAAGIETIREQGKKIKLKFNDIIIPRPIVNDIERICYESFEVHI
jgi:hypothetical protein